MSPTPNRRRATPTACFVPAFGIDEPSGWGYANDYITSLVDPLDMSKAAEKAKLAKYGIQEISSGLAT